MIEISDINDSRIGLYRNLRSISFASQENNLFVAESLLTVNKLLQSKIDIVSIFALPQFYDLYNSLINSKNIPCEKCFTANKQLLNSVVGFRLHQGIMAIGKIPEQTPLPDLKPPIVVLNGIINSENVGAIVRNAVAFGVNSVIFDKQTSHPFLRRAVRVSMGTVFSIQHHLSQNLSEDLKQLKKQKGIQIIASELNDESISIDNFEFTKNSAIIFGNEGDGISKDVLSICNKIIHIPIVKEVESLNVAASSAIVLNKLK